MNWKQKTGLVAAGVVLLTIFLLMIFGSNGLIDFNRLKTEKNSIVKKNKEIEQENIVLHRSIKRAKDDPAFLEHIAREELGMIGKDEIIIEFKDEEAE